MDDTYKKEEKSNNEFIEALNPVKLNRQQRRAKAREEQKILKQFGLNFKHEKTRSNSNKSK